MKLWVLLIGVVAGGALRAKAAAPIPPEAKTRALLLQAEVRAELLDYHFAVSRERPGDLAVVCAAGPSGARFASAIYESDRKTVGPYSGPVGRSEIMFEPRTAQFTDIVVHTGIYMSFRTDAAGKPIVQGPFNRDSEDDLKYLNGKIAAAEKRLVKKHPEFAARK